MNKNTIVLFNEYGSVQEAMKRLYFLNSLKPGISGTDLKAIEREIKWISDHL